MSGQSRIEWTQATLNLTSGCTTRSPGCAHYYALKETRRLGCNPHPRVRSAYEGLTRRSRDGRLEWTGEVRCLYDRLQLPLQRRTPTVYFVNSMSDFFHDTIPESFIQAGIAMMRAASWHTFQILTKRSARLLRLDPMIAWPPNVWMGVSVETEHYVQRIDHLRQTNATTKFLSLEPLLGPLPGLNLHGIDWVIVGGESGNGARPMHGDWVRDLREQCRRAEVAFFFKQWGGVRKKTTGRLLDGTTHDAFPTASPFRILR